MNALLQNNVERMRCHKAVLLMACVIIPLFICAAVFILNHSTSKEVIAVLDGCTPADIFCEQYTFSVVTGKPPLSALVDGTYAAYAEKQRDGTYSILSLKSEKDKEAIQTLLSTGQLPANYKGDDIKRSERGIGTNILGFITMLILMQGVALTTLYPEDRLNGTFRRIISAPCNEAQYLTAQFIFTMIGLYAPAFVVFAVIHGLVGVEIGFNLVEIAILLSFLEPVFTTGA